MTTTEIFRRVVASAMASNSWTCGWLQRRIMGVRVR
jgi:hypothetical protein